MLSTAPITRTCAIINKSASSSIMHSRRGGNPPCADGCATIQPQPRFSVRAVPPGREPTATARCARDECPFRALLAWSLHKRQGTEVERRWTSRPQAPANNYLPAIAIESIPTTDIWDRVLWELDVAAALISPAARARLWRRIFHANLQRVRGALPVRGGDIPWTKFLSPFVQFSDKSFRSDGVPLVAF